MASRSSIKVEGLSQCEEALADLKETFGLSLATARNTVGRALTHAAEPMRGAMEANAPRRKGQLKASVKISSRLSRRQKTQHPKQSPVERYVGPGPLPQAHMTEYGSAHNAPLGWARKAVDSTLSQVLERFPEALRQELQRVKQRQERKLARLLARSQ